MGYHIHTTLTAAEVEPYARHAALLHRGYARRFGTPASGDEPMPVYLFRSQWEYVNHLAKLGINGSRSDGVYFESEGRAGLAMFTEGRSANETFAVLQHEGFHQFSAKRFDHRLPIFLEEGLATYFQDGILCGNKLRYGGAPMDRVDMLRHLIRTDRALPLAELMRMDADEWQECGRIDPGLLADMYRQSWALVHALLHGHESRRDALRDYLNRVAESAQPLDVTDWLGPDLLEPVWKQHTMRITPNPLTVATDRLIFLGYGLSMLDQTRQRMPETTEELRRRLKIHGFEVLRRSPHGSTTRQTPRDEMFEYLTEDGLVVAFDTLPGDKPGLPPRIEATAIAQRPRLEWFRDAKRRPVPHIVFDGA